MASGFLNPLVAAGFWPVTFLGPGHVRFGCFPIDALENAMV